MLLLLTLFSSLLSSAHAVSQNPAELVAEAARLGKISALPSPPREPETLVRLGMSLFSDPSLSGNGDMTCLHCHHPRQFSVDGLPLSIGTGGRGVGRARQQLSAALTRRNAQALYNLAFSREMPMFWDGRVSFSSRSHSFETPEPALNGYFPLQPQKRHPIAVALDSSLAAQALFPMVSHEEMRGPRGSNDIADAPDNLTAWERLMARVLAKDHYRELFPQAFPDVPLSQLNIGHVGTAIAAFEREAFVANDTPFDRYLKGDVSALTPRQLRGAALFVGKARCVQCHSGPLLSNLGFHTVATPQLGVPGPGGALFAEDFGRGEVEPTPWLREQWRSSFRVPPLRNVALTAPYLHDGAFATLRQVVEHYNDPARSLATYRAPDAPTGYRDRLVTDAQSARAQERLKRLDERLREPLGLTPSEIDELVDFLDGGLTDPAYRP